MTNTIDSHKNEIERLINSNDFVSLLDLFSSNNLSFEEFRIFLKKELKKTKIGKRLFKRKEFWNSDLPHFHLRELLKSDLKIIFFDSYFSKNEYCNHKLNEHLLLISMDQFVASFKAHKSFKHSYFLESFEKISESERSLVSIVKEVKFVLNAEIQLEKHYSENSRKLIFGFGELCSYYLNHLNNKYVWFGNFNKTAEYEMAIADEIQDLILFYRKENPKFFSFKQLPPFCDINKLKFFKNTIQNQSKKNKIEMYCNGYLNFDFSLNCVKMNHTERYREYLLNNLKYQVEELYFSKINFFDLTFSNPKSIESCIGFWEFYGLPKEIIYKDETVDIYKVFQFLKSYSMDIPKDDIRVFPEKIWIENIVEIFRWSEQDVISIVNFLTFDMTLFDINERVHWLSKPLFKEDCQFFWLGSLLKNRRWDIILYNRMKNDTEIKFLDKKVGEIKSLRDISPFMFEEKVRILFENFGFKTLKIGRFTSSNGETGDIDVLAYKDNYLFVCEVKTGVKSDGFGYSDDLENRIINNHAYYQVQKEANYVNENLKTICDELKVENMDTIQIIKLVITDFYSGDVEVVKNDVLKTTLMELVVNLKNNKEEFFETYIKIQPYINPNNRFYKKFQHKNFNWDLWNGEKELSVQQLIDNLKNNAVWKELELVWDLKPETFSFEV
ncbi:MAG: hypothetical protein RL264_261 [Bacteroidota bacterium]|jgi:Holliday junction resolvase-like predicted endonuclease